MKTKRKRPVLKWRSVKGGWEAGPFGVYETARRPWGKDVWLPCYATIDGYLMWQVSNPVEAKAACERLAQSILRHVAAGARHGK